MDRIKWNSKRSSPQIKDKAPRRAKTRYFPIPDLGDWGRAGGGVPISHLFCPKIVLVVVLKRPTILCFFSLLVLLSKTIPNIVTLFILTRFSESGLKYTNVQ